jgi:hypothetical protein
MWNRGFKFEARVSLAAVESGRDDDCWRICPFKISIRRFRRTVSRPKHLKIFGAHGDEASTFFRILSKRIAAITGATAGFLTVFDAAAECDNSPRQLPLPCRDCAEFAGTGPCFLRWNFVYLVHVIQSSMNVIMYLRLFC